MKSLIRPALRALWATAAVAAAANLLVWLGGQAANGTAIVTDQQGMVLTVDAVAVILASVVGAVMAAVGALVIVRVFRTRGVLIFTIAGAVVTLLSLLGTAAAVTPVGVATLAIMHVVTGTVVVVGNAVIHSRAKDRAAVSTR